MNQSASPLPLRIGVHVGDVQQKGTDILGDAVNIASRVEPLAEPGGVCLSAQVYDQVHHKLPARLESLGPRKLRGVREPVAIYRIMFPWTQGSVGPDARPLPRLAVLPFSNISPDPKDEYFADGLTEELITVLSQIKGLRVISRTSVQQYKGTTKSVAIIGSELGADSVLEGSVRKAGCQLRIAVQLINTRTDEHRWSQTYERTMDNVFAIQAEVAERTAESLKVELLSSEREALRESPTSNLAAYDLYLQGILAMRRISEGAGPYDALHEEVVRCFEAAIKEDGRFSAAYSSLADFLTQTIGASHSAKEVVPRARDLATKALELNSSSSEAHMALGNLAMQADLDWERAEAEFQQAIALNPSNSRARHWYGVLLMLLQRFTEAKRQYVAAIEVDPLWAVARAYQVEADERSGDRASATARCEKAVQMFPQNLLLRCRLAELYVLGDRGNDALRLIDPLQNASDLDSRDVRAWVLALLGRPEQSRALVRDWEAGRLPGYFGPMNIAGYYALWGEKEKALALLERDTREGDRALWARYQAFYFDPLREEPRFVALLRQLQLPTKLPRSLWQPPTVAAG